MYEVPESTASILRKGRLSVEDAGALMLLAVHAEPGGLVRGSVSDFAQIMAVGRQRAIDILKRLRAAGVVEYDPASSRHIDSEVKIVGVRRKIVEVYQSENRTDKHPVDNLGKTGEAPGGDVISTKSVPVTSDKKDLRPITPRKRGDRKGGSKLPDEHPAVLVAGKLLEGIRENIDDKRKADVHEWAGHIDKLNRIDERSYDEISLVVTWLHDLKAGLDAEFWRTVVLSGAKLRKQFPSMIAKMNGYRPRGKGGPVRPRCVRFDEDLCDGGTGVLEETCEMGHTFCVAGWPKVKEVAT